MAKPFSNNLGYRAATVYCVALPYERAAVFDNFCANEKRDGSDRRVAPPNISPDASQSKYIFWPPGAMKKYRAEPLRRRSKRTRPFFLIRHHRVTRESAEGGSPQDSIPLLPG